MRKEGPAYDLPIATAILAATGLIDNELIANMWIVGELSLNGSVRPVTGVLPIALAAKKAGASGIVVPEGNAEEAALVDGLKVYPVSHLMQVLKLSQNLNNGTIYDGTSRAQFLRASQNIVYEKDYSEVKGQDRAKRALEISAAGRHNMLMVGPPGAGKSMLAERLPSIMPPLEFAEAIELTKLFSVAGLLTDRSSVVMERPFRSPHHSASAVGLVGGGQSPKPGEISLSHLGVLFLDELTEFPRGHLDNLRQPLESRQVTITRAGQTLTYPASFVLIAACNPCPCGYRGDRGKTCVCTTYNAERYWSRVSGPLLDRIDMQVNVPRLLETELSSQIRAESSSAIHKRVMKAIGRQRLRQEELIALGKKGANKRRRPVGLDIDGFTKLEERNGDEELLSAEQPLVSNSMLTSRDLARHCAIDEASRQHLANAVNKYALSARAYDRILRVARTIADLENFENIDFNHVSEALTYRVGEVLRQSV